MMRKFQGFSLMEMMIVLLITAIVAAASAPMINRKLMENQAENGTPWVYLSGTDNSIAYNLKGGKQTAMIGAVKLPTSTSPRLYLESNGTDPQIEIGTGGRDGSYTINASGSGLSISANTIANSGALKIGKYAAASENSLALGNNSKADAEYATAIGPSGKTSTMWHGSVPLPTDFDGAKATKEGATAIGYNAIADGLQSTALGYKAIANADNSIVIGKDVTASGANSIVIGDTAQGPHNHSLVIGHNASTQGLNSIAIGQNARAGTYSIAIGSEQPIEIGSVSLFGEYTNANGPQAIAIGRRANSTGASSIAIGTNAVASGTNSIAIGENVHTQEDNTIVIGRSGTRVIIRGDLEVMGDVGFHKSLGVSKSLIAGESGVFGEDVSGVLRDKDMYYDRYRRFVDKILSYPLRESTFITKTSYSNANEVWEKFKLSEKVSNLGNSGNSGLTDDYTDNNPSIKSDYRLKNVGKPYCGGLKEIKKLEVFNYTFKKDMQKIPHVGVMAQDLEKIFPNAVTKGDDGFLRIRFEDMFYSVVNAIKELDKKLDLLEQKQKRIEELEDRIKKLEKRLDKLSI